MYKLLVVDDEPKIREVIREYAEFNGYEVTEAADGMSAVGLVKLNDYDLVILDIMMPKLDGFSACKEIKKIKDVPVIMLSARGEEYDKLFGFELGIDDYVVKPFSSAELLFRIKAILRRSPGYAAPAEPPQPANRLAFQDVVLDLDSQTAVKGGQTISLTYTEFKILELLASHKKKIYSLENIYQSIWDDNAVGDSAIMVHIKNIRKKLGDNSRSPMYIKTAWGRGYYID